MLVCLFVCSLVRLFICLSHLARFVPVVMYHPNLNNDLGAKKARQKKNKEAHRQLK